jgi:plasmid stabilization system protein ParE
MGTLDHHGRTMTAAEMAWRQAVEAIDAACRALAEVPSAGDQHRRLRDLANAFHRDGAKEVAAAWLKAPAIGAGRPLRP